MRQRTNYVCYVRMHMVNLVTSMTLITSKFMMLVVTFLPTWIVSDNHFSHVCHYGCSCMNNNS